MNAGFDPNDPTMFEKDYAERQAACAQVGHSRPRLVKEQGGTLLVGCNNCFATYSIEVPYDELSKRQRECKQHRGHLLPVLVSQEMLINRYMFICGHCLDNYDVTVPNELVVQRVRGTARDSTILRKIDKTGSKNKRDSGKLEAVGA